MTFVHCKPKELQQLETEMIHGKRHYILPSGVKVPSVTTVVGAMKAEAIQQWKDRVGEEVANKISREASNRGTNMHNICESYLLNNEKYSRSVMPDALEMFRSIKPYINNINNIHYLEAPLYSEQLFMAGRCDVIGEYNGKLSVIDFKTSRRLKTKEQVEDYFWQTTAYALMYEELIGEPIDQLVIIMAVKDEQPILFIEKTEDHIDGLVKCIQSYRKGLKQKVI